MSNDRNSPPLPSPGATDRRRASITGQTFQDLFGRQNSFGGQSGTPAYPGPITTAAVNAQRRRLSLTTVGLSQSPNQSSPFQMSRPRTESLSSANSGSVDESPFEDEAGPSTSSSSNPTTPFARRLSFGARALRDVRQSNGNIGNANGRPSVHKASSPPTARSRGLSSSASSFPSPLPILVPPATPVSSERSASASAPSSVFPSVLAEHFQKHPDQDLDQHELTTLLFHTGEGYNVAENLRSRAQRTSISTAHPLHSNPQPPAHQRAKSVAIMEPPAREMPKQAKVPDAFGERILKGDFYMD